MKSRILRTRRSLAQTAVSQLKLRRGPRLFHLLEVALSEAYGRHLTLRELAFITSQGIATLFDWRTDAELRQVETLLVLLERLTPSKRLESFRGRFILYFPVFIQ